MKLRNWVTVVQKNKTAIVKDETVYQSGNSGSTNRAFHNLDEIGNNANIGIRGFTVCENKRFQ